jgi:hypothetical protein
MEENTITKAFTLLHFEYCHYCHITVLPEEPSLLLNMSTLQSPVLTPEVYAEKRKAGKIKPGSVDELLD